MAWLDKLLKITVDKGASDLHVSSGCKPNLRFDGRIQTLEDESVISPEEMEKHLVEVSGPEQWEHFQQIKDHDFAYSLEGIARFRTNYFMDRKGPGAVFRIIPDKIPTAEQLGLPKAILDFCNLSKGLVLVTGPTGSGKSTTLAAMINEINQVREDHIITIEDPIEFVYENKKCLINQREVHGHTESFKKALRAALREDPDIVLVGEMRDLETVEIAIETAETGHLVFGTLHTNTAASTVNRVVDQFPHERQAQIRSMLAESLKGVVAQTLCRKIEGGRCAAQEILVVTHAVAANIREGKIPAINNAIQVGRSAGMQTMNDSLLGLVEQGLVAPEEAYMKSVERVDMKAKLDSIGFSVEATEE